MKRKTARKQNKKDICVSSDHVSQKLTENKIKDENKNYF